MNRYAGARPVAGVVGLVLLAAALAGCAAGEEPADAVGTWGEDAEGEPRLVIAEDGTASGTDGCNSLNGTWSEGEDRDVTFGEFAVTQMACEGVDDWLSSATTAEVEGDGDELVFYDESGEQIGTLARVA